MRFDRLRVHNMGVFADVDLDLTQVPGPLVALVGDNGSGKSTALGLLFGGIYRDCPTRGSLADLATARDSFVEVSVFAGNPYVFRQSVDAISKKGETLITNGTGNPVLANTKLRDADAWVAEHMPAKDVVLASLFAAQQSSGLLGMGPGERKAVLLKLLGIERLEDLAERARKRASATSGELSAVAARISELGENDLDMLEFNVTAVGQQAQDADATVEQARAELEQARQAAQEAERAERERREALARRAELRERLERADLEHTAAQAQEGQARQEVRDLAQKIRNNQGLLRDREQIEAAVRRRDELSAESAQVSEALRDIHATVATTRTTRAQHEEQAQRATILASQARQRAERLRQDVQRAAKGEEAARELPARRAELEQAERALAAAEAELEALRGERLAGAEERIGGLRGGLACIARSTGDSPSDLADAAQGTLDADDQAVEQSATLPERLREAQQRVQERRVYVEGFRRSVASCAELAALAGRAEQDRQALAEAEEQERAETEAAARHRAEVEATKAALARLLEERGQLETKRADLEGQREELAPLADKAPPLALAEQRIADRTEQKRAAEQRVQQAVERTAATETASRDLRTQLDATPEPVPPSPPAPEVAPFELQVAAADREAREAHAQVAVARQALVAAQAAAERLDNLQAEQAAHETELADWRRLADDLGRGGLQAALVDAAIPELNTIANDLLHEAFGPRFTLDLRTQRIDSTGKRLLEALDVVVIDTERGREAQAESLSGGERVIVQEALSLALTTVACRQNGIEGPTIVRDETGAALDPEKATQYLRMLRRAADLIGASRLLFVSHSPDVHELADARIVVRDGRVEVEA